MVVEAPIVAVSSPPGRSARGLVRLSGDHLAPLLADLFDPPPPPRRLTRTRYLLARDDAAAPIPLACLACFFPADHSFTGQDVIELQVPGNPALLERVLAELGPLLGPAIGVRTGLEQTRTTTQAEPGV